MEENNQQPIQRNGYWGGLLSGLLLALLVLGVWYIGSQTYDIFKAKKIANSPQAKEEGVLLDEYTTSKVEVIEDTIRQYYLEDTGSEVLENGIYSGMVAALGDPYSTYYSAEELQEIQMGAEGIYYGIGAYISKGATDEFCTISGVIENTPAEEAGLREGDIIYEVDGILTQGMDTTEVVSLIKGDEGTKVVLTLVRDGEDDYLKIEVERRKIESPTVTFEMKDNNIAYIQITEFDDVTETQFSNALTEARAMGMEGLILDLRSNPGGNLSTVCEIARMVLPKGLIVYTEDKYGSRDEYTSDGKQKLEVPAVVLVNDYSASASEILAGAMKDHGVATIMGTTTFGKGIVQRIISLSDGSAVKLTVSKYYTPSGADIHEKGIEPDVEVIFDSEAYYENDIDNQIEEAMTLLTKEIGNK
ncbi:MAG: S41 family peptidase [Lachnospiraceae bacterium]|nr:S41 family peptidase [Lachnospiraceae bacterium]